MSAEYRTSIVSSPTP